MVTFGAQARVARRAGVDANFTTFGLAPRGKHRRAVKAHEQAGAFAPTVTMANNPMTEARRNKRRRPTKAAPNADPLEQMEDR